MTARGAPWASLSTGCSPMVNHSSRTAMNLPLVKCASVNRKTVHPKSAAELYFSQSAVKPDAD